MNQQPPPVLVETAFIFTFPAKDGEEAESVQLSAAQYQSLAAHFIRTTCPDCPRLGGKP